MSKVPNIYLIGPMGSGKSTIGRHLARELQMDFYDSDKEIEDRTGVTIPWIFDVEGEKGFRLREQKIIEELTEKQGVILATGGGVVLSPENRNVLAARGIVVYLKVSLDEQINRTEKSQNRPLIEKQNIRASLEALNAAREEYYLEIADLVFDTDERSAQSVVKEIVTRIHSGRFGSTDTE